MILEDQTEAEFIHRTDRVTGLLKIAMWIGLAIGLVWVVALTRYILFAPPPATFIKVQLLTPYVQPTGRATSSRSPGNARLMAWVASPQDASCLVATAYILELSDGTIASMPGMRVSTRGDIKVSIYEASVPRGATVGPAQFFVRDAYSCGLQTRRVESPRVSLMIGPSPAQTWRLP